MKKVQAFNQMIKGNKIRHEYFGSSEYLYMEYGIIYSEEGYIFEKEWDKKDGPEWEEGWSLYGAA